MRVYLGKRVILGLTVALAVSAAKGNRSFSDNQKFIAARDNARGMPRVHLRHALVVIPDTDPNRAGYRLLANVQFLDRNEVSFRTDSHLQVLTPGNSIHQAKRRKPIQLFRRKSEFIGQSVASRKGNVTRAAKKRDEKNMSGSGRLQTEQKNRRHAFGERREHSLLVLHRRKNARDACIIDHPVAFC